MLSIKVRSAIVVPPWFGAVDIPGRWCANEPPESGTRAVPGINDLPGCRTGTYTRSRACATGLWPLEQPGIHRRRVARQLDRAMAQLGFLDQMLEQGREQHRLFRRLPEEIAERAGAGVDLVEPDLAGLLVRQEI